MVSGLKRRLHFPFQLFIPVPFLILTFLLLYFHLSRTRYASMRIDLLEASLAKLNVEKIDFSKRLASVSAELAVLRAEDQRLRNDRLEEEIKSIETTFKKSVNVYESLLSLQDISKKADKFEKLFAFSFDLLAKRNYASASAILSDLEKQIKAEKGAVLQSQAAKIAENITAINTPPSSGYRRQNVVTNGGTFTVDIVSTDLNSTRVIVDTASESDCRNDCPVLSLGDYAARNGAYAGVNGSYFCPASYPSCVGKTNSFDTLLMNKNKKYFNSDNNVYSTVPAVIFAGNSMRFVGRSLEWGRDTGVDGVIANFPLLVSGGQVVFGGDSDPKLGSKGGRSFVGSSGSTGYIGVVHSATVAESARVIQTLGIQNALNLDDGGSTALWAGGYKVGPGRNIPNAILFVRK